MDSFVELQPHETRDTRPSTTTAWQPVHPEEVTLLSDARQQLHHAAQLAAAAGISFLNPRPDDSHTNLEWVPALAGLFSRTIPATTPFRVGVRPVDLTLLVVAEYEGPVAHYRLHGRTIIDAAVWIRAQIATLGGDPIRYALKRHFEIPGHPVALGDAFDASDRSGFAELTKWLANGASTLDSIARSIPEASEVRCWPHHFDIATLIRLTPDRTIGVGLEPGDHYYDEPYIYVNMSPQPTASEARSRPLWGRGRWHTHEWVGAVLTGSRLGAGSAQEQQVLEFIDSAVSACRGLATVS